MLDILDKTNNDAVKQVLSDYINKPVKIKYNLGRNKQEIYTAIIKNLYNCVFIVQLEDKNIIKSFSYADVITKTIKIYDK